VREVGGGGRGEKMGEEGDEVFREERESKKKHSQKQR
jgi:hypothetical protein